MGDLFNQFFKAGVHRGYYDEADRQRGLALAIGSQNPRTQRSQIGTPRMGLGVFGTQPPGAGFPSLIHRPATQPAPQSIVTEAGMASKYPFAAGPISEERRQKRRLQGLSRTGRMTFEEFEEDRARGMVGGAEDFVKGRRDAARETRDEARQRAKEERDEARRVAAEKRSIAETKRQERGAAKVREEARAFTREMEKERRAARRIANAEERELRERQIDQAEASHAANIQAAEDTRLHRERVFAYQREADRERVALRKQEIEAIAGRERQALDAMNRQLVATLAQLLGGLETATMAAEAKNEAIRPLVEAINANNAALNRDPLDIEALKKKAGAGGGAMPGGPPGPAMRAGLEAGEVIGPRARTGPGMETYGGGTAYEQAGKTYLTGGDYSAPQVFEGQAGIPSIAASPFGAHPSAIRAPGGGEGRESAEPMGREQRFNEALSNLIMGGADWLRRMRPFGEADEQLVQAMGSDIRGRAPEWVGDRAPLPPETGVVRAPGPGEGVPFPPEDDRGLLQRVGEAALRPRRSDRSVDVGAMGAGAGVQISPPPASDVLDVLYPPEVRTAASIGANAFGTADQALGNVRRNLAGVAGEAGWGMVKGAEKLGRAAGPGGEPFSEANEQAQAAFDVIGQAAAAAGQSLDEFIEGRVLDALARGVISPDDLYEETGGYERGIVGRAVHAGKSMNPWNLGGLSLRVAGKFRENPLFWLQALAPRHLQGTLQGHLAEQKFGRPEPFSDTPGIMPTHTLMDLPRSLEEARQRNLLSRAP